MSYAALRTGLPAAVLVGLGVVVALIADTGEASNASAAGPGPAKVAAAAAFAVARQASSASADLDGTGPTQQADPSATAAVAAREEAARQAAAQAARSAARPPLVSADPRGIARAMVADRSWGSGQFSCLDSLWRKESGWNPQARNPSSGAFGVPQALPGTKMASAGSDWRTNPATQIEWGLDYIAATYGTPCGAWAHSRAVNWY